LILNLNKTVTIKFITKDSAHKHYILVIKYIEETVNTKFLGLQIDNKFEEPC